MDDSDIICDEVIDANVKVSPEDDDKTKTIPTNFNEKKVTCKMQNLYILLSILLITTALLIAVHINCYMIKYRAKQKHLLTFCDTKLKQIYINNIN